TARESELARAIRDERWQRTTQSTLSDLAEVQAEAAAIQEEMARVAGAPRGGPRAPDEQMVRPPPRRARGWLPFRWSGQRPSRGGAGRPRGGGAAGRLRGAAAERDGRGRGEPPPAVACAGCPGGFGIGGRLRLEQPARGAGLRRGDLCEHALRSPAAA